MKKKVIVLLTVLVFTFQFVLIQPREKAEAAGLDTLTKFTAGVAIVRALAEQVGVTLTQAALNNVTGYIQKQTALGSKKAIDFVNNSNALTPSGTSTKTGFKKYSLSPSIWLDGLDLILGAIGLLNNPSQGVTVWGSCVPVEYTTYSSKVSYSSKSQWLKYIDGSGNTIFVAWDIGGYTVTGSTIKMGDSYGNSRYVAINTNTGATVSSGLALYTATGTVIASYTVGGDCYVPPNTTVVNTSNVDQTVMNNFNNDTYNTNTTYVMTPDIPDSPNYADTTPWNSVDPNLPNAVNPDVTPPNEVSNLTEKHTEDTSDLSWNMPTDSDFSYVRIFRDGTLVSDNYVSTSYHDSGLTSQGTNTYKITTVDSKGNESSGTSIKVDRSDSEPVSTAPSGSSWWKWLLKPILDFISGIGDFLLKMLVPTNADMTGAFNGISDSFKAKIPIADQLGTFFTGIKGTTHDDTQKPTFKVTMPAQYGGGTFDLIDFSYFDDYRDWVLNFIRFSAWFVFLRRLYNRIPKMIY